MVVCLCRVELDAAEYRGGSGSALGARAEGAAARAPMERGQGIRVTVNSRFDLDPADRSTRLGRVRLQHMHLCR